MAGSPALPVKIAVVGAWHQASVVSACFADLGYVVRGIGDDAEAIAGLGAGRAPVYEPGLDEAIRRTLASGRLRYGTDYGAGLQGVEFAFVCIDTPVGPGDESDLGPIEAAIDRIAGAATHSFVLCVSAQVPIGTCHRWAQRITALRPDLTIPVVYVPEFLRLGSAIQTFVEADRFVIGADDPEVGATVAELYAPLGRPMLATDVLSAEMGKHASNAFLATSISFINEIADVCERTGADVTQVAQIMKLDRRIGPYAFLSAGLGYAGGTLGREIRALHHLGEQYGVPTDLLDAVGVVNERRVPGVLARLKAVYPRLRGLRVAVLGLTYKAGTSTLRRSAALELIDRLVEEGASVAAFDPLARLEETPAAPALQLVRDVQEALAQADAAILISPWARIEDVDWPACAEAMKAAVLLDAGNYLTPARLEASGFRYLGVGRGGRGAGSAS